MRKKSKRRKIPVRISFSNRLKLLRLSDFYLISPKKNCIKFPNALWCWTLLPFLTDSAYSVWGVPAVSRGSFCYEGHHCITRNFLFGQKYLVRFQKRDLYSSFENQQFWHLRNILNVFFSVMSGMQCVVAGCTHSAGVSYYLIPWHQPHKKGQTHAHHHIFYNLFIYRIYICTEHRM